MSAPPASTNTMKANKKVPGYQIMRYPIFVMENEELQHLADKQHKQSLEHGRLVQIEFVMMSIIFVSAGCQSTASFAVVESTESNELLRRR